MLNNAAPLPLEIGVRRLDKPVGFTGLPLLVSSGRLKIAEETPESSYDLAASKAPSSAVAILSALGLSSNLEYVGGFEIDLPKGFNLKRPVVTAFNPLLNQPASSFPDGGGGVKDDCFGDGGKA